MKLGFKLNKFFQNKTNIFIVILIIIGILVGGYALAKKYIPTTTKTETTENPVTEETNTVKNIGLDELATALTGEPKSYVNKTVSISAIPANVDADGNFLEYTREGEDGTSLYIVCYVLSDNLRTQLKEAEKEQEITVEGTVVSYDETHYAVMVSKLTAKKHEVSYSVRTEKEDDDKKKYTLQADGADATSFTGLCKVLISDLNESEDWYFFTNGVLDTKTTGLYQKEDTLVYVAGGKVDSSRSGIVTGTDGVKYLVLSGKVATDYTGKYINHAGEVVDIEKGVVKE